MHNKQIENEIFGLLKSRGPLDVAQICTDRILSHDEVLLALESMEQEGSVEKRLGEMNGKIPLDKLLLIYGLRIHQRTKRCESEGCGSA